MAPPYAKRALLAIVFIIGCGSSAIATNVFWILPSEPGNWDDASNWSTLSVPSAEDIATVDNGGIALIDSGAVNVGQIFLGPNLGGELRQSGGALLTDLFDIASQSIFSLNSGSLSIQDSLRLEGTLDLSSGDGAIVAADNSVIDLSLGTLISGGSTSFTGGVGSTLFLPLGVAPTDLFASFDTRGDVFNVSGATLVVPLGFTLDVSSDRPDLIRVEGVLRPEGAPASPVNLTFDQGGVEVATGGVFDLFNRTLTLRTDSSVRGGEIRDGGTLTIGDRVDDDVTFTQASGSTNVGSVRVGYATSNNANPRGELRMDGGTLSIGGSLSLGSNSQSFISAFTEGVYRQTAGATTVSSSLSIASGTGSTGNAELLGGSLTTNSASVATGSNSDGELLIDGAMVNVGGSITVGRTDGSVTGNLTQASGDLTADQITIRTGSQYDLTGGTLTLNERFDLTGTLDFNGGDAAINVGDEAVVEWATGTLAGSAAGTTYSAGIDSESYFPAGFDPMVEFASFNSQGLVHTEGTPLVVPTNFTLDVASDRPDLIRVVGTLRPQGSPASPQSLTFDKGGVEVTPTGLFNLFGASLTLRSDMLVDGGEVRNAGTLTVGDVTNQTHTFTQTSGMTDINGSVRVGYATANNSTSQGVMNVDGGTLSIGGSLSLGSNSQSFISAFTEGVYRQTAGATTVSSSLSIASGTGSTGNAELLGGSLSIGGNGTIATGSNSDGTLAIGGGTLAIGGDLTVGRTDGNSTGQLTQAAGDFSLDQLTVHAGSRYDLTGGTLTLDEGFDLNGTLNLGGTATINVGDQAVIEWATGTLTGSAAGISYSAGVDSESYFPTGFDPFSRLGSFNSGGLVQASGTAVVVPRAYSGDVLILNADNIAISGDLRQIEGGAINAASVTINGGRFSGGGVVTTEEFVNSGTVEIGPLDEVGELMINSPFEQTALGVLEVQINGLLKAVSYDHLEVDDTAALDGLLKVELGAGFIPSLGSAFEILSASAINGEFSALEADALPAGTTWDIAYGPQTVSLLVASTSSLGDFNSDGRVDAADYTVWRDLAGQLGSGLAADGNADGTVDGTDYDIWVSNYGRQFASISQPAAVPEPGTILLALACLGSAARRRR